MKKCHQTNSHKNSKRNRRKLRKQARRGARKFCFSGNSLGINSPLSGLPSFIGLTPTVDPGSSTSALLLAIVNAELLRAGCNTFSESEWDFAIENCVIVESTPEKIARLIPALSQFPQLEVVAWCGEFFI